MTVNTIAMSYANDVVVDKDISEYFKPEELTCARQCSDKVEYILAKAETHFQMSELSGMYIPLFRKKTPHRAGLNKTSKTNP